MQFFENEVILNNMDKSYYIDFLKEYNCKVVFTKNNGDERTMFCTLNPDYFPEPTKSTTRTKKENPDVISVWDIENDGWRSFNVKSIKSFSIGTIVFGLELFNHG